MKLPKEVFIKSETNDENSYLVADADLASLVAMGDNIKVGRYRLVGAYSCKGVVKSVEIMPKTKKGR
jgi:hypothetical protein